MSSVPSSTEILNDPVRDPAEGDTFAEALEDIKQQILDLLKVYPYLSRSMIQVGIGPAQSPKIWGPVLESLVGDGTIMMRTENTTTHKGRALARTIYHLSNMAYPPVESTPIGS